jgi:hypothetical protein
MIPKLFDPTLKVFSSSMEIFVEKIFDFLFELVASLRSGQSLVKRRG